MGMSRAAAGWTRRRFVTGVGAAALAPLVSACTRADGGDGSSTDGSVGELAPVSVVDLPVPSVATASLGSVLRERRSVRAFGSASIDEGSIGELLWAAQGVTDVRGHRSAPSAGALYPLELLAITADRVFRYEPDGHRAEVIAEGDLRPALTAAALGQEPIGAAPLVIAVAVVRDRTAAKYGDRAGRFVDIEVGHAAQNLLLHAVALGLAAVPIGGFDDGAVTEVLGLPAGWEPRYLIAVGHPVES